jgi:FMN phosphatase YigB (HAD superfamily)
MFDYTTLRALLVDIDNTVVRFRPGIKSDSLVGVLQAAGVALSGLTSQEASRRIEKIKSEVRWWHLSDFIVALELNPKSFWRYALEIERHYVEPAGPEMLGALQRLRDAGILLFVTSNNPSSGILHKLSIAGLATVQGAPLFSQLLGASELQAMKWEPIYWKKVLAHIGLDAEEVAVVGDDPIDDYKIPRSIGIAHTFLINRETDASAGDSSAVTHVMDFDRIVSCLLNVSTDDQAAFHLSSVADRAEIEWAVAGSSDDRKPSAT